MVPRVTAPPRGSGSNGSALSPTTTSGGRRNGGGSSFLFQAIPYLIVIVGIANYALYVIDNAHDSTPMSTLADSLHFSQPIDGRSRMRSGTSSNKGSTNDSRPRQRAQEPPIDRKPMDDSVNKRKAAQSFNPCEFRSYPSHRYYEVSKALDEQPSFLSEAKYIRGEKPIILNPPGREESGEMTKPTKVCIDTAEWEDVASDRYPFSDGQNPSIVSLSVKQKAEGWAIRFFAANVLIPLCQTYGASNVENMFIGIMVVGNAQCGWRMEEDDLRQHHFSDLKEAPDRRTIVTILDEDMETLAQMTLMVEHDAPWGTNRKKGEAIPDKSGKEGAFERSVQYFDDPRFYFHRGHLFVLYRNGPRFGYENQVQNMVHLEKTVDKRGKTTLKAFVKASETFVICCGRNIAFISENGDPRDDYPTLKALTWIDPVTVIDVDPKGEDKQPAKKEKSNIHGTNGYMLPLHATNEYLGIAHFHRPEDRKESEYALHGHHYTHAFFTVAKEKKGGDYKLKRISNEFLFRAMSPTLLGENPPQIDAETIQFASGLDLNGSDVDGKLLITYGVNDCEGGTFFVDMKVVQEMLLNVTAGQEVNDLMAAVETNKE